MTPIHKLVVATAFALPVVAFAQTTNPNVKPADQPRTQLEKEQTTENGQATKYPATSRDVTTGTGMKTNKEGTATTNNPHAGMKHDKATDIKPGDVPTYPAPAKDGTPTK